MFPQEVPRLRLLLTSLRFLGLLPYTLTSASSSPQLDVKWLMWSIFILFFNTCTSLVILRRFDVIYTGENDFYCSVIRYSAVTVQGVLTAMQYCVTLKSKSLLRAYQILSEKATCDQTPSRVTFVDCCVIIITCIYLPYVTVFYSSLPMHYIELTLIVIYTWAMYFTLTAYIFTFKCLYSTISQKLSDEVQQAITSSTNQLNDESNTEVMNGNITMTTPALNQLEREICTVSHSVLKS